MKKIAFPFNKAGALGADKLGGKASNLLWLWKHNFNVPEGFCLTSDAYQDHLLPLQITPDESAIDLKEIQNFILEKPIDSAAAAQIETYYQALSSPAVAVRSSATAEDLPEHSFAGQYETCLNVKTFTECLEAIKKCWASVWTERAYRYRQKNKINHACVKMAVIIQRQVDADFAGVAFTCDPLTGSTDRIVVEICQGLGDALVSGRVTPDQMIFTKKKLKLIWNLPAILTQPCQLNLSTAAHLAKFAKKIETLSGCPQDIEWAIHNNRIHFLQTRPVTVLPKERSWDERQIWTNANTGEVAPDVVTPMDWSVIEKVLLPWTKEIFYILSIECGKNPLFGVVAGRLYFNVNTGLAFFTNLPSFLAPKPEKINALFGGGDETQYNLRKINLGPDDLPDLKVSIWNILLRFPYGLLQCCTHRLSQGLKILDDLKQKNQHYGSIDITRMTECKLVLLLDEILEKTFKNLDFLYMGLTITPILIAIKLCERWMRDQNCTIANSLLSSAGDMDDVRSGLALHRLAQLAEKDATVCRLIQSHKQWQQAEESLRQSKAGCDFIKAWGDFMQQYGHHCRSEILISNPRWYEKPDYVLEMLKSGLGNMKQGTPARKYEQNIQNHNTFLDKALSPLKNPLKRLILKKQIKRAQKGLAFRENLKSEIVRSLSTLRRIVLCLGTTLRSRGVVENIEDVFFLEFNELKSVVQKKSDFNISEKICQRQKEYQRYKAIEPPQVIIGKFDPENYTGAKIDSTIRIFHGMSACPGKVTGSARVILLADEQQQVLPGEILVAPFTDPGWTPYFINAAAIVMDQGGLLSHGSIVAREYGIPAVVNVGPATKIIKTGQTIEVDAYQGVVRVLS